MIRQRYHSFCRRCSQSTVRQKPAKLIWPGSGRIGIELLVHWYQLLPPLNFIRLGLPDVSQPLIFGSSGLWWLRPAFQLVPVIAVDECWGIWGADMCRHTSWMCTLLTANMAASLRWKKLPPSMSQLGLAMGLGGDWPWLSQGVSAGRQIVEGGDLKLWLKLELWSWKFQAHLHH